MVDGCGDAGVAVLAALRRSSCEIVLASRHESARASCPASARKVEERSFDDGARSIGGDGCGDAGAAMRAALRRSNCEIGLASRHESARASWPASTRDAEERPSDDGARSIVAGGCGDAGAAMLAALRRSNCEIGLATRHESARASWLASAREAEERSSDDGARSIVVGGRGDAGAVALAALRRSNCETPLVSRAELARHVETSTSVEGAGVAASRTCPEAEAEDVVRSRKSNGEKAASLSSIAIAGSAGAASNCGVAAPTSRLWTGAA
ncbi:MAG TPA: hypothetical protein VIF40_13560 [Methylosinus sp.]|uniref:hypothetical protein n=1 Tax=Methylosinus sp. TaxID=427 RepID=UPI002F91C348